MCEREKEVVTDEFIKRDDTYNIRPGGDYMKYKKRIVFQSEEYREKMRKLSSRPERREQSRIIMSRLHNDPEFEKKRLEACRLKLTPERLSEIHKDDCRGTRWINKDGKRLRVKPEELDYYLSLGWKLKMK